MSWDYAELAHTAKEFGGPRGLVDAIYEGGLLEGRIQGGVIAGLGLLAAGGIGLLMERIVKARKTKSDTAKAVLIDALEAEVASNDNTDKSDTDASNEHI